MLDAGVGGLGDGMPASFASRVGLPSAVVSASTRSKWLHALTMSGSAFEPGPFIPQVQTRQRSLHRKLDEIVAVVRVPRQRQGEPTQPRQESDDPVRHIDGTGHWVISSDNVTQSKIFPEPLTLLTIKSIGNKCS